MFCSYGDTDRIKDNGVLYSIRFGIGKIKKLYPLHIITMLLAMPYLVYAYLNYSGVGKILNPTFKTLFNISLLQSWIPNSGFYFSLNAVSWYLSVSLFLYVTFPFILSLMKKYNGIKTAVTVIVCVLVLQVVMAFFSYHVQVDLLHSDNFVHWFVYIFPVSRLEDFVIGCNLGYIFKNANNNKEPNSKLYSFMEMGVIAIIIVQWAVYVLMISIPAKADPAIRSRNWWGLTVFWTVTSCSLVYLFAIDRGRISKILANKLLVFIGNMSANAFLIHQMVYRYLDSLERKMLGNSNEYINIVACFLITMISAYIWEKIIYYFQNKKNVAELNYEDSRITDHLR